MYKGEIEGFPREVVEKMLEYQVAQGNERDITVFENGKNRTSYNKGFDWTRSIEGYKFWSNVIGLNKFDVYFKMYDKTIRV